jgi:hypothetical protein
VMLTHASLLFIARNSGELRRIGPRPRLRLLPVSHVYGLRSVTLGTLLAAAASTCSRASRPRRRRFIRGERSPSARACRRCTRSSSSTCRQRGEASFDAPALRFLYAGGSPLVPALKREVERVLRAAPAQRLRPHRSLPHAHADAPRGAARRLFRRSGDPRRAPAHRGPRRPRRLRWRGGRALGPRAGT